ncbi:DUF4198 domain-containing protein [Sulfitobacter guttiformis]|uniref:Putative GH25 family protein n=1 Tax=Sulfitobacter guttiformis TaxID=74349 RepID=A0A420DTH1_9RHOB|nr:DUF4198 domain-containing protein [Sulfitobacter guttiformis]KIN71069.1 DUF4198 domain containing protein [Sulfitobacter guttiformis KCTC 32187]RKE97552.1 putative GH25 family protein [Sulfitobacter guttiformis]
MGRTRTALIVAIAFASTSAKAHEVWIEPSTWQMPADTDFTAQLLNGQNLEGQALSWDPRVILRAETWQGTETAALQGRFGDVPALTGSVGSEGLLTLLYQSKFNTVVYQDYEKFVEFLTEKNHLEILDAHAARSLPKTPIKEAFSRFSKALIAVGTGAGEDMARGLEIEIVALDNPYTSDITGGLRFQALFEGEPLKSNRVTLFERDPAGMVQTSVAQTDAEGIVRFPIRQDHTYLVDTVVMRQPDRALFIASGGAFWESLWASLTFSVPSR